MAKDKKKDPKKGKKSSDLLDNAVKSLKKFRRATKHITKLSKTQKVVGGVALLAAGLTYLAKKQAETSTTASALPGAGAAEANLATLTDDGNGDDGADYAPDWAEAEPEGSIAEAGRSKKHR